MHITSRQNPHIKRLRMLGTDPAFRRKTGVYLADGRKLLNDALRSGVDIEQLFLTEGVECPIPPGAEVFTVPKVLMESIALTDKPQGVLFTCKIPPSPPMPEKGCWLILDRVQDPGNVGSIFRTAEAFGLNGVMLTQGCADPFSPKVVRAAMGATFRLPIVCEAQINLKMPLIVTAGGCEPQQVFNFPKDCVVALGNEGQGVSPVLREMADKIISIPMKGEAESLGVAAAAAILCWEISKGA